ncbi:MAG: response regulator [Verrucomicrobia bacterium]|nr:response regulator [Verrucomicrobiota bacterium]
MKILSVEDDPVARAVLRRALRRLGHDVIDAVDGEDAWEKLAADPVRVVVSDWMMPRVDGLELCRRIRSWPDHDYIYFVLLTSRDATEENQRAAADAGVDDFLTKPLDFSELWTRLRVAERILHYTTQVRQLEELLPICSYCKKIRDDHNYWQQIEGYINERTGSEFSHSVCPDCYTRVVIPEIEKIKAGLPPGTRAPFLGERKSPTP